MLDIAPLYTALTSVIAATWPDVAAGGIGEGEHAALVPWELMVLPNAAIVCEGMGDWPSRPVSVMGFLALVDIYRVQQVDGPSTGIWAALVALSKKLWPGTQGEALTVGGTVVGQVVGVSAPTWNESLLPNARFAEQRMPARAGRVTLQVTIGEYLV